MLSLNAIGTVTLVLSGTVLLFAFLLSINSLSLKLKFQVIRSLFLELLFRKDKKKVFRFYKKIVGVWEVLARTLFRFLKIDRFQASLIARQALIANFFITSIALTVILIQLATNDFTSKYVVNHSSSSLPLFYRLTAVWAGSSGSLLFWYFLLTLFSLIFIVNKKVNSIHILPVTILIFSSLQMLFLFLMLYYVDAQPFLEYHIPMQAGRSLNPLLLHWAMIIHPPILYIGYVSYAIPFAIFFISLLTSNFNDELIELTRKWSVFAWFFLGFGILLGSLWAYEELGWGGFWAWDPVENASLMPFLLGTAFLHSFLVQEYRGLFKFWNALLIILTYHFCLLGTWITRSGMIEGPHSFAKSDIGIPMIIFILASAIYFLRFLYFKRHALRSSTKIESLATKEGGFLFNNILSVVSVIIILIGVFSPLIPYYCVFENGLQCFKVEWKPSTYNKIMVPVGLIFLLLMGISPLLTWRKSTTEHLKNVLKKPLKISLYGTAIYALIYFFYLRPFMKLENSPWGPQIIADIFSILTVGTGIFTIAGIVQEYSRAIAARKLHYNESFLRALINIFRVNHRRYGGYLMHISVVLLFIGYSGSAFKTEYHVQFHYTLMPVKEGSPYVYYYSGDKAYIQGYTVEARELFLRPHFEENADPSNPIFMTVSQEAHFRINPTSLLPVTTASQKDPFEEASREKSYVKDIYTSLSGIVRDNRMVTERRFYPQVYPYTGDLLRNQFGFGERLVTSEPDILSTWTEDIYIQVGSVLDPDRNRTPDISSMFEFYYYELNRNLQGYYMIFPRNLIVDLQIWINPFMKFLWVGTILFLIGGLVVLIPLKKNA